MTLERALVKLSYAQGLILRLRSEIETDRSIPAETRRRMIALIDDAVSN